MHLLDAFSQADAWIEKGITSIWKMMSKTGLMNLDYSQLRQVFSNRAGKTLFGLGEGSGENAAIDAIEDLKLCPLLHTPEFSKKADHLLVNLIGGASLGISETQSIMESVTDAFGKEANVVMELVIDESMGDKVEICVIGTSDMSDVSIVRTRKRSVPIPKVPDLDLLTTAAKKENPKPVHKKRRRYSRMNSPSTKVNLGANSKIPWGISLRARISMPRPTCEEALKSLFRKKISYLSIAVL